MGIQRGNALIQISSSKPQSEPVCWCVTKLELSSEAYEKALSIDPNHKDALEYQGELFLTQEDIAAAKNNLDRLESLCPNGCEQLEKLTKAIADREKKP